MPKILMAVCLELGVEEAEVRSELRHKRMVLAREFYVFLCRALLPVSYPEIGRTIGKRHSTMILSHQRIDKRLQRGDTIVHGGREVMVDEVLIKLQTALTPKRR